MSLLLALLFLLLPSCATEDSSNCAWDATVQGNGTGRSFVDVFGTAYYAPEPTVGTSLYCDDTGCVEQ